MTKVKKWKEWVETQMKEWGCKIEVVPVINLFGIISLSLTRGRLDKNPENWSEDDKKRIEEFLTKENLDISLKDFSDRLKEEIKQISEENFKRILDEMDVRAKKTSKIQYFPEDHCPPNVAAFVNRSAEQTNLEKLIRQSKKHMILILGIAGIGKTQIAAKLLENIKTDYITYWKEMYKVDTFYTVTKNLAGFLRDNNDPELA
ncbi:MAG: hypothetical protein H0M93_05365, partial [Methanophagales archaeon]|nr:hypothetical protein [Methanophagales archaeon]